MPDNEVDQLSGNTTLARHERSTFFKILVFGFLRSSIDMYDVKSAVQAFDDLI